MSVIIDRIKHRISKRDNSWQNLILGMPGTGKSTAGLEMCLKVDPSFTVKRVIFTPEDFMKLINDPEVKPGSAILADEVGSWMAARDWYSMQNKLMSIVLETYRYKRLAVFWTVPLSRMADNNLQDLCHSTTETLSIDYEKQQCICKYKYREANPITGKVYYKFPVTRNKNGDYITLTRIRINRPPRDLEDAYKEKKKKHMEKQYKEYEQALLRMKGMGFKKRKKKKRDLIIRDLRKGIKPPEIARKYKTSPAYVREVRINFFGKRTKD